MKKDRLFMAICAVIAVTLGGYFQWIEPAVVSYSELPFQVLTPLVRAGESVLFVVARTIHTDKPVDIKITRWLMNGRTGERTDLLGSALTIKWDDPPKIGNPTVPHSTKSGFYRICGETNVPGTLPWVHRDVSWCSQTFQVIGAPDVMAPTSAEGAAVVEKQRSTDDNPAAQPRAGQQ